jgi:hypothetical protein
MKDQIKQEKMIDPRSAVLYYPRPTSLISEMEHCHISVSNYVGEAREDIFTMAEHLGARTSRTMSSAHTHLICSSASGEKYERALQWNIHVVNHFWIEEIYATWQFQREAKPKYLHFSVGVGDMVNKSVFKKLDKAPSLPFVVPISLMGSCPDKILPVMEPDVATHKSTPVNFSISLKDGCVAAVESSVDSKEKENLIPNLYSGDQSESVLDLSGTTKTPLKRSMEQQDTTSSSKRSKRPLKEYVRLIFTGIRPNQKLLESLWPMGLRLSDSMDSCDILITNRVATTVKFLFAITKGVPIVHESWVTVCVKQQKVVDYTEFLLKDETFDIQRSLKRAVEKPLLEGYKVYFTANVFPEPAILKKLVMASGGVLQPMVTLSVIDSTIEDIKQSENYLFLSSSKDSELFPLLSDHSISVCSGDLLLNSILKQELTILPKDLYI